jgi:O-antigen/teichoic acid export membrane protein
MIWAKATVAGPRSRFGAERIYWDAASMASSSVANALLGVAFWAIAAKVFPPEKLGVMTAVMAVIMSVGLVVAYGIGDAYTALLPAAGVDRSSLYRRGQRVFFGLALASSIAAAVGTITWLDEVRGSIAVGVLVAVGVFAWSNLTLQNSTLVALGRARWLLPVNIGTSVGRIVLLLVLAATLRWHSVELASVISAVVVIVVLRPAIARVIKSAEDLPPATVPEGLLFRKFNVFVTQTVASSALTTGLLMITPFLVTVYSDPKQGALFALSLSIVQALDLIGAALAMSLVVHASSAPDQAGAMTRMIMIRVVLLSTLGAIPLVALAPTALRLLRPEYGAMGATGVIAALAAGTVVRCVYVVWSGLQRARRNMAMPLILNVISAVVLLATMPFFARNHGAFGGALALLLTQAVLITGITVHFVATRWTAERGPASAEVV